MGAASSCACCGARDENGSGVQAYDSSSSPKRPQLRKGSIAAFMPGAEDQKSELARGWEKDRRNPISTERFNPERQTRGRRTSVVTVSKEPADYEFIVATLKKHPLFEYLGADQLDEIANVIVPVEYMPKAVVYHAWEKGDDVYIIKEGSVVFSQSNSAQADEPMYIAPEANDIDDREALEDPDEEDGTVLTSGAVFGELAGIWKARRGFTAKTMSRTVMFTIGREALRRTISSGVFAARRRVVQQMRPTKLLGQMEASPQLKLDLMELSGMVERVKFEAGQRVFGEGEAIEQMLLVETGELEVNSSDGGTLVLGRGDYCGELALVRGGLRWSASGSTTMPSVCLRLARDPFRAMLGKVPMGTRAEGTQETAMPAGTDAGQVRDGPCAKAASGEVPATLAEELYSEFQKLGKLGMGAVAQPQVQAVEGGAVVEDSPAVPASPSVREGQANIDQLTSLFAKTKALKAGDFEWCCELNERERLVGAAYWGGKEAWRGRVSVFLAKHRASGQLVAIRVYDKALLWQSNGLSEVKDEHSVLKPLRHSRLLAMLATFQDPKCLYFVMELVLGTSVWALMQQNRFKNVPEATAQHYTAQVLSALRYLHAAGVTHRCIHPEALLIDREGWLRLGSSMFMRGPHLLGGGGARGGGYAGNPGARQWTLCGVPEYLAPEVIQGVGHGRMADIWAVGILIHEMTYGRTPFYSDDPLDGMRSILLNQRKSLAQGECQSIVEALTQPDFRKRLGYRGCGSPAAISSSIDEICAHAWFHDIDMAAIELGEGTGPHVPPSVPVAELSRQTELAPAHLKSGFLHDPKTVLQSAEQEVTQISGGNPVTQIRTPAT